MLLDYQQHSSMESDNGLAPTRRQAIIWPNNYYVTDAYIRHSASMGQPLRKQRVRVALRTNLYDQTKPLYMCKYVTSMNLWIWLEQNWISQNFDNEVIKTIANRGKCHCLIRRTGYLQLPAFWRQHLACFVHISKFVVRFLRNKIQAMVENLWCMTAL